MNQEDKELLLQDLCARVPYHPKGHVVNACNGAECDEWLTCATFTMFTNVTNNCRLYLRPMSSMTEEEILELYKITYDTWYSDSLYYKNEEWINFRDSIKNNNLCFKTCIWLSDINKVIDWLLKNHFDYRGLIPMGLAIEVTEENNPYET